MQPVTKRILGLTLAGVLAGCIPPGPDRMDPGAPLPPQREPTVAPGTPPATEAKGDGVTALPSPPPAWEARRVVANARSVGDSSYVVRPSDTLRGIANTTGAGSEAIARANDIPPPFTIRVGQRLTIPGGRYHAVREGETGIAIARAYGVDWSRIVTANGLAEPYILRTGQRILIPGDAVPRSAAERAAAFRLDIDDILTGGEPAIEAGERPVRPVTSPRRVLPSTAVVTAPVSAARADMTVKMVVPTRGSLVCTGGVRAGEAGDRVAEADMGRVTGRSRRSGPRAPWRSGRG